MYNPNVCTPTMFEDELRALSSTLTFADPQLEERLRAVDELRRALSAVREIPGWSGDSAEGAEGLLMRMESNTNQIKSTLNLLKSSLDASTHATAASAAAALRDLPSASAEGFLADLGRNLSGLTDGWGAADTGELVAQEEARLAAERENAAMVALKAIRGDLVTGATTSFDSPEMRAVDVGSIPPPVIDVEGIDSRVPPVGSNGPSGGPGTSPGGTGVGSVPPPQVGTWVPGGGGDGGWVNGGNGGSGGGNTGTIGDNGWDNGDNGGSGGNGGSNPSVDSPNGGTLPGYPGIGGGGGGGGLLAGGSGGSGTLGAAVVGGAGAAALMGARSASLNGAGGAGLFGGGGSGAGAGAATAGRGLLGMGGATGPGGLGAAGSASGSATGAAGGTTAGAGGRSMAPGMMGGAAGDDEKRRDRSGLGGPIAPKLEDDEEAGPRSRSAQAGSRDTLG
ncbi:hypothetical protein MRBLWH13_000491 [Microbacterium sp. LWH13-1.2]